VRARLGIVVGTAAALTTADLIVKAALPTRTIPARLFRYVAARCAAARNG
jgi:hypothetical protein